jgi:hypothetical protein
MFSFIETRAFTKLVLEYLTDAEYAALQAALIADAEAGPVIPGSGGVIWMLTMYPKNVADSIPAHVLRQIREEVDNG